MQIIATQSPLWPCFLSGRHFSQVSVSLELQYCGKHKRKMAVWGIKLTGKQPSAIELIRRDHSTAAFPRWVPWNPKVLYTNLKGSTSHTFQLRTYSLTLWACGSRYIVWSSFPFSLFCSLVMRSVVTTLMWIWFSPLCADEDQVSRLDAILDIGIQLSAISRTFQNCCSPENKYIALTKTRFSLNCLCFMFTFIVHNFVCSTKPNLCEKSVYVYLAGVHLK